MNQQINRDRVIIRTSVIGILANFLLVGFKAVVGLAAHSIAILMDAVNNLSDAASSVITIVGTKLAGKQADRKHPFGHGRVEYLSAMLISVLVLYAGIAALVESIKKIIHPDTPDYRAVTLIVVAAAVAVKILLGLYVKRVGRTVRSDSLLNSGADALWDAVISAATLAAAGIFLLFHVSLEAWLGAAISLFIIKSGVEMLRGTLSKILGERADAQLVRDIKKTLNHDPAVRGAYDLILHNYGPDAYHGSVHIEVADTLLADDIDRLIRKLTLEVYRKHRVILTAIGVYSFNTKDPAAAAVWERIQEIVSENRYVLQMHGFYLEEAAKIIRFDVVVSFDAPDRNQVYRDVCARVEDAYPEYTLQVILDADFDEEEEHADGSM